MTGLPAGRAREGADGTQSGRLCACAAAIENRIMLKNLACVLRNPPHLTLWVSLLVVLPIGGLICTAERRS